MGNPKHCAHCAARGAQFGTVQEEGFIYRRYICRTCNHRWCSVELTMERGDGQPLTSIRRWVHQFLEQSHEGAVT